MKLPKSFFDINFQNIKQEIWFWFGFGIFLYGIGKFLDHSAFILFDSIRTIHLNNLSILLTEKAIWGIISLFVIFTFYRVWKDPDHQSRLLAGVFAVIFTGVISFTLKSFFHLQRPFMAMDLEQLVAAPSYSFPSAHTAFAFALLIPFFRISRITGVLWMFFALLIGLARVYQNVHYPSDIAGGIFLGGLIGTIFSNPNVKEMLSLLWKQLEFRRQTFHFLAGFLCVFAHWAGFFRLRLLSVILVVGLILSLVSIHRKIPIVSDVFKLFDRPRDKNFPGRGAYYFLLSVFLVFFLFSGKDLPIAYASILILAVGDSINHLFDNKPAGRMKLSWNRRKNFAGLIVGILGGAFAAQFFVPLFPALLASTIAILIESVPFKFGKYYIDDNLLVPLSAGAVLWLFI